MKKNWHFSRLYRRLFVYVKPFWPVLLLGLIANILSSAIDAGFTYMMRPFLDKGFIDVDLLFIQKKAKQFSSVAIEREYLNLIRGSFTFS